MEEILQVIAKFLDGKHSVLNFKTPEIPILTLKARIQELTSIPAHHQLLLSDGKTLDDTQTQTLTLTKPTTKSPIFPTTITLLLRLRGGKGGFGSLLRGAATKAGQKKTNNFDACRDMSGRRLRHVNMEKKVEEWNAEAKGRELEKIAEEYIKKQVKLVNKSGKSGDGGAERYVEKYRLDSAKCMEEVDKCVRESLGGGVGLKGKRTVGVVARKGDSSRSKRLKIWRGKRKVDYSDSDEVDDSDSDAEDDGNDEETGEEIEKSVVINNENHPDSIKGADQSSRSVTGEKADGESSVGCSSESGSVEEDGRVRAVQDSDGGSFNGGSDNPSKQVLEINEGLDVQNKDSDVATVSVYEAVLAELETTNKAEVGGVVETTCQVPNITTVAGAGVSNIEDSSADIIPVIDVEAVAASSGGPDLDRPLNFDDFSSAAEMEVLGLESLKSELQARGLKCGGTLHERAARLFLLKTTPLEMLPKKLLARK